MRTNISRSENMSRIKSKNTKCEKLLRQELWKHGLRYRKNDKSIFGKPDIAFKSKKIAIFCDSEFWHGKKFLEGEIPKTNTDFWIKKLKSNIQQDKEVNDFLKSNGWLVLRFWEKNIIGDLESVAQTIYNIVKLREVNNVNN